MEEPAVPSPGPTSYASVLRRRKWLIAVILLVGAPVAVLTALAVGSASYTSSTTLLVRAIAADPFATGTDGGSVSIATERQVVRSTLIASRAAALLNRDDDPAVIIEHTTARGGEGADRPLLGGSGNQGVLVLEFEAGDPVLAARYAEALSTAYLDYRRDAAQAVVTAAVEAIDAQILAFEARLDGLVPPDGSDGTRTSLMRDVVASQLNELERRKANLLLRPSEPGEVITPATVPEDASGIPVAVNVLGALGLVGLAAVVAAFVVDRRDRHVRGRQELATLAGPVLAALPRPQVQRLGSHAPGDGHGAVYGGLAVQLSSTARRPLRRVLLAAPRGSGAAVVAAELAVAVAAGGQRTLFVPCDGDDPTLDALGLGGPGRFDELVAKSRNLVAEPEEWAEQFVVPAPDVEGLWVAAGGLAVTRSDVFPDFTSVLDTAAMEFDLVVVSGPPLLELPNSVRLASVVDGVVVVFDPDTTDRKTLEDGVELLGRTSSDFLGTVVLSTGVDWR